MACAAQLKLSYSVHRELNVKTNSDRSWDYTAPVQAPGANQGASDAHASHGNGMHGYGGTHSGGHGGYGGTHSGGHGGGHSGGHARGGHEEPVLVTGTAHACSALCASTGICPLVCGSWLVDGAAA